MILSFTLSMPNKGSWDGKWSGEGRSYVITRSFSGKCAVAKAEKIRDKGYFHYSWPDGWGAGVRVEEIDSRTAISLRKKSAGFCGYDWMVASIIDLGKISIDHQAAA